MEGPLPLIQNTEDTLLRISQQAVIMMETRHPRLLVLANVSFIGLHVFVFLYYVLNTFLDVDVSWHSVIHTHPVTF